MKQLIENVLAKDQMFLKNLDTLEQISRPKSKTNASNVHREGHYKMFNMHSRKKMSKS